MKVSDILLSLENRGHEAYIVGGYVRDKLLGIESFDVDISTSARPEEIENIFEVKSPNHLGSVNFKYGLFNVDVTSWRVEHDYENRHPRKVEFTGDVLKDIERRDFTINAIMMDKDGIIFDPLEGRRDLENKIIRPIGNVEEKLTEDPLRILRAIRFAIVYGFNVDASILKFIKNNASLLSGLSKERVKGELEKIFCAENLKSGIEWMESLGVLDSLGVKFPSKLVQTQDILGIWAQITTDGFSFTREETKTIEYIRTIVSYGQIDDMSLFNYGLEANLTAGEILKVESSKTKEMYSSMPIKTERDLDIDFSKLPYTGREIGLIKTCLVNQILNRNLVNENEELMRYIMENWK